MASVAGTHCEGGRDGELEGEREGLLNERIHWRSGVEAAEERYMGKMGRHLKIGGRREERKQEDEGETEKKGRSRRGGMLSVGRMHDTEDERGRGYK